EEGEIEVSIFNIKGQKVKASVIRDWQAVSIKSYGMVKTKRIKLCHQASTLFVYPREAISRLKKSF
ncbi:MAG TPA: hypothetical protein PK816_16235, partial [Candidatus Cloacimonadota bacterium]|nr:hypothetical protein [Candidatus Cloacimonadota bacterium]